jgi:hypothetical protein
MREWCVQVPGSEGEVHDGACRRGAARGLLSLFAALALVVACDTTSGGGSSADGGADAAQADAIGGDAALVDTGSSDVASPDALADGSALDATTKDTASGCPTAPPDTPGTCDAIMACEYGEECCCGECYPAVVCSCDGAAWSCHATDACLGCVDAGAPDATADAADAGDTGTAPDVDTADTGEEPDTGTPTCPAEAPVGMSGCDGPATCEYGEECCCGECYASLVCACSGGSWSCHATDACLIAGCPCHGEKQCEGGQSCVAPDDPPSCGICMEPETICEGDVDCADLPGTVCDIPVGGCFCEPIPQCVPACTEQSCAEGESCVEGHCIATPCATAGDCPSHFECVTDASGACARTSCAADADCGAGGFCVNGRCYGQPGLCQYPVP